jgi:hypothetical protein
VGEEVLQAVHGGRAESLDVGLQEAEVKLADGVAVRTVFDGAAAYVGSLDAAMV